MNQQQIAIDEAADNEAAANPFDQNGDGILDDTDGDGIADLYDVDCDGNGIIDMMELTVPPDYDTDGDGVPDDEDDTPLTYIEPEYDPFEGLEDTNGDGIVNIMDASEEQITEGLIISIDENMTDYNGWWDDIVEWVIEVFTTE